jgi:AcrR family transcriptional regulator
MASEQQRIPLSRDRILHAALELADGAGIEALTMRRLGEELGYEAMSLYRHVASKDDLLDGMLDLVLAEWELPAADGDAVESIRTTARSVHQGLRRHPWAARLLMTGAHIRPRRLAYGEFLLAMLAKAGLDADRKYHVYHLLDGFIFGFSLWEIAYTSTGDPDFAERAAEFMRKIPWDDYPNFTEHRDQHLTEGPHREVSAFDVGLDLILAGLRQEPTARTSPA